MICEAVITHKLMLPNKPCGLYLYLLLEIVHIYITQMSVVMYNTCPPQYIAIPSSS